jgi:RimJ/RimL family protein N-acetyltransferase
VWNRLFALAYDPFVASAERRGIAQARRELLAGLTGDVLEIGAGTGLNLPYYPAAARVTFTEPDPHMAKRLRRRGAEVVEAEAESLPFADGAFDAVVSTLVLCTVGDVQATLREIRRVLRLGGMLLFLEHVRAPAGSSLERWQDRLHGPWRTFAGGCHCNRDLLSELARSSFAAEAESRDWRFMPAIVRPVVVGRARPTGVLREVVEADLPAFYEYESDPEAAAMAGFPSRERDAFMAHWARTLANESALTMTIVCDGEVAGNIGCWEDGGQRFVGYWIGRAFWGRGLATKAVAELVDLVEARPLHAHVVKSNVASIRVLEKNGFVEVGRHTSADGIEELVLELAL